MPISNREAAYIWDILQAAIRIQEFTAGLSCEGYCRGEAFRRSPPLKFRNSEAECFALT